MKVFFISYLLLSLHARVVLLNHYVASPITAVAVNTIDYSNLWGESPTSSPSPSPVAFKSYKKKKKQYVTKPTQQQRSWSSWSTTTTTTTPPLNRIPVTTPSPTHYSWGGSPSSVFRIPQTTSPPDACQRKP